MKTVSCLLPASTDDNLPPENGGTPLNNKYKITPALQMSASGP